LRDGSAELIARPYAPTFGGIMTRKLVGLTSKSRLAKRLAGVGALGVSVLAIGVLYACSGDDNSTTAPPVNDAGPNEGDSAPITNPDGGPITTPDGGDASTPPPSCESLPGTIVYIESADTQEALLDTVGRQLRDKADVTLVFLLTGSCTVTPAMYGTGGPTAMPATTSMLYIPSTAESSTWTPAVPEFACTLSQSETPDLGIAALFPSSCAGYSSLPQGSIQQYIGPTQAYTFIVPSAEYTNGQTSISAPEAYYAFGDGADNPVTPAEWNVPADFYLRPGTKSTLVSTAANIHLKSAQMTDVLPDGGTADGRNLVPSSGGCESAVASATPLPQAIGILGDEVYDSNRAAGVNILAFKTFGQNFAYFPDSTATSYDKQNIRDGHYTLWSPDVYMAPSTGGVPTNPTVKYLLDIILGNPGATTPDGGANPIDGLQITAGVGLTPSCAMQVTRTQDGTQTNGQEVNPYAPTAPCTCKFLSDLVAAGKQGVTVPASCTACTTAADCSDAAGALGCFNGFCETAPTPLTLGGTDAGTCDDTVSSGINACTNAAWILKDVTIPTLSDGGLEPVTQ
jgi:hypothetical protein